MCTIIKREFTTSYVWDLTNFSFLERLAHPGYLLQSPLFNIQDTGNVWKLHVYPKGKSNENYIGFYVFKQVYTNKSFYSCKLSIGKPDQIPVKSYKYERAQFLMDGEGEEFFLCKKSNPWIFRGPVRFQCDIAEIYEKCLDPECRVLSSSAVPYNFPDNERLSLDLEELLNSPFNSDLTLSMNGRETYIHKYMLYSRCPSLKFGYQSVMEIPSFVETEISENILERLIYYIYTGKLKDSYVSLELLRFAKSLDLSSLICCVHEPPSSFIAHSAPYVEKQAINWNLDELSSLEESSTFIHLLSTTMYAKQLAIQVTISDNSLNEKLIDISFKFFNIKDYKPILLICGISVTSQIGLESYREEHYVFLQNEQWNFPRISCQKDEHGCINGLSITAELSIFDRSHSRYEIHVKTKTKLYTNFQTVTDNLDNLRFCMGFLTHSQSTSNLLLISSDKKFFPVHDGIMWARWPGLKRLLDISSDLSEEEDDDDPPALILDLPSEVLGILLQYSYTGFIMTLSKEKAKLLLEYRNILEIPDSLVTKCADILNFDNGYISYFHEGGKLHRRILH